MTDHPIPSLEGLQATASKAPGPRQGWAQAVREPATEPAPHAPEVTRRTRLDGGRRLLESLAAWRPSAALGRRRLRMHFLLTSGLDLPGVVRPLALQARSEGLVLIEPLVEGVDLQTLLFDPRVPRHGVMPLAELLDVGIQLGQMLVGLEREGVVHGGIAASTVLVDAADPAQAQAHRRVHLVDFGSGRFVQAQATDLGTRPADHSDDLHALGGLLFRLATGRQTAPLRGPSGAPEAPHWAPDEIAQVPSRLLVVVRRLMIAGSPGGYRSAAAAVAGLQACLASDAADAAPDLGEPPYLALPLARFGHDREMAALIDAYAEVSPRRGARPAAPVPGDLAADAGAGPADGAALKSVLVLVDGVSGIGKSAVVTAACQAMARHGARVALGKFNQFGDSRPFWALAQALDNVLGGILGRAPQRRAQLADRLRAALADLAGVLFDALPRLEALLGPQPEPPVLSGEASAVRFELLMRRLVAALASPDEPLVLVMDDLQWADSASLALMRGLLMEPSIRHLVLIGAFRTEAVAPGHPLLAAVAAIESAGQRVRHVTVHAWTVTDVERLLEAANVMPGAERTELAQQLARRTAGNPFGVLQALNAVHAAGALPFQREAGARRALPDLAGIVIGDRRPVDLMVQRVARLPKAAQEWLSTGAFLGASFDLDVLATAGGLDATGALGTVWPALAQGMLEMVEEGNAPGSTLAIRFAHDIVQQAAHARVAEAANAQRHVAIGQALLDRYVASNSLLEHVFEVVQQFNCVPPDAIGQSERGRLVELNLNAGRNARRSGAAATALEHFKQARKLLALSGGTGARADDFGIALEQAEATYLAGQFEDLDLLINWLASQRTERILAAKVQELRIQGLLARNQLAQGLEVGQAALATLDVALQPMSDPRQWPGIPALAQLALDPSSDERIDTALRLLVWLTPCAYITSFEMYARVILTMIELARQHPGSHLTPISYTNYGLTLCGVGRTAEGFAAGQLALQLSERIDNEALRCKVWTLVYGFLQHWQLPVADSLAPLLKTVNDSLHCGDQEYLGYASFLYCDKAWGVAHLPGLERDHQQHTDMVAQFGHDFSWRHCRVWLQFIQALQGRSHSPLALRGEAFDETQDMASLEASNNRFSLFTAHTLQSVLAWHRGDAAASVLQARQAAAYAATGGATLLAATHRVLWVLGELQALAGQTEPERSQTLTQVQALMEQMRGFARIAPCNFAHQLTLLEAEWARAHDEPLAAWQHYEAAWAQVAATALAHDKMLIAERAGSYYRSRQMEQLAHERMTLAYEACLEWGATGLAESLLVRHPWLAGGPAARPTRRASCELGMSLADQISGLFADLEVDTVVVSLAQDQPLLVAHRSGPTDFVLLRADGDARVPSGFMRHAEQTGAFLSLNQPHEDPQWRADPYFLARRPGTVAAMALHRGGKCVGSIYVESKARRLLTESRIGKRLGLYAQLIHDELRADRLAHQLDESAQLDAATGMPNRVAFTRELELRLALDQTQSAVQTAVIVLRVRRLDDPGVKGDEEVEALLADVAGRLAGHALNAAAKAGRIDRLSFALVLSVADEAQALAQASRLHAEAEQRLAAEGPFHPEVDVGIALAHTGAGAATLLRNAELALAGIAARGRGEMVVFDPEQHRVRSDHELLARDLKWALQNDGLRLVFQPIVDMRDGALLGAEALVRWRHPVRGEIRADVLIAVAEEAGLIKEVGRWVTRVAVAQAKRWPTPPGHPPLHVSINASPLELDAPGFAGHLLDCVAEAGLPVSRVMLEITESTSVRDDPVTQQNLRLIDEAGIVLCIDDFGVGTSSLSRLHAIRARRLKVDRSFLDGMMEHADRRTTVTMIIRLAEALHFDVVCEGINDAEQVAFMVGQGVVKAQGYFYARPLEAAAMDAQALLGHVVPESQARH